MIFQWPEMLYLLLLLPLLVALYLWLLGRKKKFALRYASLDIVKEAMGSGIGLRRHIPPLICLLGLTVLILAIARPTASVLLPSQHETIILAMDVSGSMRATDVEPNRLVAAQNAAKAFVAEVPDTVRIGVVAFAGTATVAQAPTRNKEEVVGRSTASSCSARPRSAARSWSRSPPSSRTPASTSPASPTRIRSRRARRSRPPTPPGRSRWRRDRTTRR